MGQEECHFIAPASLPDDPLQPSGRVLLTARRALFAGGGATVPRVSEIPVLGTLFKTAGTAHVHDRQLMILITPTVLSEDDGDM